MLSFLSKRKVLAVLIALSLILGIALAAGIANEPPPRTYIALGDSVSYGFGVAPEMRHADLFFEKLKSANMADEYYNYAVNGYTTSMLLDFLRNTGDPEPFANASVITINIGGNNILIPLLAALPDFERISQSLSELAAYMAQYGDTFAEVQELMSEGSNLSGNISIFNIGELAAYVRRTVPVMENVTDALRKGAELDIMEFSSLLLGTFPPELEAGLQNGVETFAMEFKEIIGWLKTNAPDAVIIVNTVYNPIPGGSYGMLSGLHARAANLTGAINGIILQEMSTGGYLVSDVSGRYFQEPVITDILNFDLDMETMTLNFDIIHPNAAGHEIIADLNYKSLEAHLASIGS